MSFRVNDLRKGGQSPQVGNFLLCPAPCRGRFRIGMFGLLGLLCCHLSPFIKLPADKAPNRLRMNSPVWRCDIVSPGIFCIA